MVTQSFEFARMVLAFIFELLGLRDDPFAQFETVALAHVEVFLDPRVFAVPVSNTLTEILKFGVFNTEVGLDGVNYQIPRTDANRVSTGSGLRYQYQRAEVRDPRPDQRRTEHPRRMTLTSSKTFHKSRLRSIHSLSDRTGRKRTILNRNCKTRKVKRVSVGSDSDPN